MSNTKDKVKYPKSWIIPKDVIIQALGSIALMEKGRLFRKPKYQVIYSIGDGCNYTGYIVRDITQARILSHLIKVEAMLKANK